MHKLLYLFALCLLLALPVHAANRNAVAKDGAEKRVALVIGNSAYKNSPLVNPVHDAEDVAAKLRSLGFDVIARSNLRTSDIGNTLNEFRSKLSPGAVALVFYAGHGVQIKGENYLPAVDANINSEYDVPTQSLALNQIMDVLDTAKTGLNLVFLDACRNNPYASRSFRSTERGLARVSAPSGTLISYATKPGSVAEDGNGRNGLYTSKLLPQLASNQPIEQVLKKVVSEVKKDSRGKQEPWMEGSIEGDFCFAGCLGSMPQANLPSEPAPAEGSPLNVDDLRQQQQIRQKWADWQSRMQADYQKILTLSAEADLLVTAWERFLNSYAQDNPYSQEDEQLRSQAQNRKTAAQQTAARPRPVVVPPATPRQSYEPEMVAIPTGHFNMGSNDGGSNEKPVHTVNVGRFELGKTEVTQGQWQAVMGSNPSNFSNCGDTCPVEQVSWDDAQSFIQKLNQMTGKQYRLPSESEWEYACRAGQSQTYCGSNDVNAVAWYTKNSGDKTHPVGGKQPNGFGLYDMSGNVWEWVQDSWHKDYSGAPSDGRAWEGGSRAEARVLRGGSWDDNSQNVRAANRNVITAANRNDSIGFRLARTLP